MSQDKKFPENALLKNAEKRIKDMVPEGEIAYATSDGQVFARPGASAEMRKNHAQNWAARFRPILEVKEVKGAMKPKAKSNK